MISATANEHGCRRHYPALLELLGGYGGGGGGVGSGGGALGFTLWGQPRHQCGNLTVKYVGSYVTSILANTSRPRLLQKNPERRNAGATPATKGDFSAKVRRKAPQLSVSGQNKRAGRWKLSASPPPTLSTSPPNHAALPRKSKKVTLPCPFGL